LKRRLKQKKIKDESLESLRRRTSFSYQHDTGKVKEVFDILEGTVLADKIQERVHYT
jgi:hypothetical protein